MSEKYAKVVLIGIDALDPIWLLEWIDELPTFRSMMEVGTFGPMRSTVPPLTIPAWATMLTGKSPVELGSFGLFDFQRDYSQIPINAARWRGEYIWDLIGARGRNVGVLGMPLLSSPYPVNGFLITDPSWGEPKAFPSELSNKLRTERVSGPTWNQMRTMWHNIEAQKHFILEALENPKLDFFFFALSATDVAMHWGTRKELKDAYIRTDSFLSEIIDACKDRLVLVVSDHGCKEGTVAFNVPTFLSRLGLLRFRQSTWGKLRRVAFQTAMNLIYGIPNLRLLLLNAEIIARKKMIFGNLMPSSLLDRINLRESNLFPSGGGGSWLEIWINRMDQYDLGRVPEGGERNLVDCFVRAISAVRDPSNGKPILRNILTKRDLGWDNVSRVPDLFAQLQDSFFPIFVDLPSSMFVRYSELVHSDTGVFLATGPGIRKHRRISEIALTDVAPTVLHILGMPVPHHMNGRVLREVFEPDSEFAQRDVDHEHLKETTTAAYSILSSDEEERITDRLRSLGYL